MRHVSAAQWSGANGSIFTSVYTIIWGKSRGISFDRYKVWDIWANHKAGSVPNILSNNKMIEMDSLTMLPININHLACQLLCLLNILPIDHHANQASGLLPRLSSLLACLYFRYCSAWKCFTFS